MLVIVTTTLAVGVVIVFLLATENGSLHSETFLSYSGVWEMANGREGMTNDQVLMTKESSGRAEATVIVRLGS